MANNFPASGLVTVDCLIAINNVNSDNTGHLAYQNNSTGVGSAVNAQLLGINKYGCGQYMMWEEKGMRIGLRSVVNSGCGDLYFTAGSDNVRMFIGCNGKVGIGTTSPSINLHVQGTCNNTVSNTTFWNFDFSGAEVTNLSNCPSSVAGLALIGGSGRGSVSAIANLLETTGLGQLAFFTGGGATGTVPERMRINSVGNVGIGTTSPAGKMHISHTGAEGACALILQSTNSCGNGTIAWRSSAGTTQAQIGSNYNVGDPAGNLEFITTSSTRLLITSAGCVGIGTSSPGSLLTVTNCNTTAYCAQNTLVNGQWLRLSNPNGTAGVGTGLLFEAAGAVGGNGLGTISGVSTAVGSLSITFGTRDAGSNVTERMRLTSDGNVGIGTTSPSYRLHVNGTFYAAGSSIKYKEGICNYDTDSCLFMCLKPVTYQYKDEWQHLGRELKSQSQIGLIAEDVAQVMPELAILVNEEDEKVVRNVDYEKLSVVLLKEVQKLRQEVDELKNNK